MRNHPTVFWVCICVGGVRGDGIGLGGRRIVIGQMTEKSKKGCIDVCLVLQTKR